MKLLRGLLLKPTLNLLGWILRHRNGNSLIIGGPLGWTWEPNLDATHHGALVGPTDAHRHSDLANIGIDNHHARDHATRHQDGGADEIGVAGLSGELADEQKSAFTKLTGRWTLAQAHRGADGKVLVFKGPAADPVEGDPIPKADDESGNFTYTTGYGISETDISALFTTPLTGTTRRKYTVYLDLTNFEADGNFDKVYVAVKAKVDGTNYRAIDRKTIAKADIVANAEPGVPIMVPAVAQDVQITFKLSATLAANRVIYYHYVKEFLE